MSRSICTVFVALAIFQGALAINVEPHSVINLVVTNETSPTIKSFDGERSSGFIGDMKLGNFSTRDNYYETEANFSNTYDFIQHVEMYISLTDGRKINNVQAVNKQGGDIAFCGDESSLGSTVALLNARFPPLSWSIVHFTIGSSGSVNAIQAHQLSLVKDPENKILRIPSQ